MKQHWKERFGKDGVCNFKDNYDFYFKWLLSKTCSCFYITGLPETCDEFYIKSNLIIDGDVCITDFNGKLYALNGAPGGQPDEYYRPTIYTVANPVLGSKMVKDGVDGIILYNTPLDAYISGGLYGLINQTATLLADNIVSINCSQINTRVQALVTADSEAQALAGEIVLKKIYTGHPYQILRSDLIDKIAVNPLNNSASAVNIAQLIELHNYIISNYFQSIGIKSNDVRKNAHVLQEEIDVQNNYLQISILELLSAWQEGFDRVNKLYGTDIHVELNPALIDTIIGDTQSEEKDVINETTDDSENLIKNKEISSDEETNEITPPEPDESENVINNKEITEETTDTPAEYVKEANEQIEAIVDIINDNVEDEEEEVNEDEQTDEETGDSEPVE